MDVHPQVSELERRLGADWKQIRDAAERAQKKKDELRQKLAGLDSEDTSVVVFGSLARDEFTEGSDIDWMAVDFAYKQRTRFGQGAAMRNIKLRMSRKLIYVSGLLVCFGCELKLPGTKASQCPGPGNAFECVGCLSPRLRQTPLDILAGALLQFPHLEATARKLFDSYNSFLGVLADAGRRDRLEALQEDQYEKDEVFQQCRAISHDFRDAVLDLLFDQRSGLFNMTRNYGVL